MTTTQRDKTPILVTSGLPYANGSIHLGHLVEYLQTDIYVRFLRACDEEVRYICASDTHGAPIEVSAKKAGVDPEAFVTRYHAEHLKDLEAFGIAFDIFYTTHSEENRAWATRIYEALRDGGHLSERESEQLYCSKDERFLPDRFVKGRCPHCAALEQYGDICESCGNTYAPHELQEPHCVLCGETPSLRSSTHLYVKLSDFSDFLKKWVASGSLQPEIRNFVEGWLKSGLQDWCVTRDAPYFGFEVPDRPGKYFYVWLDAPVGYISSTEKWAKEHGDELSRYWERPGARIIHFIGKDIVYFHTLFWPAMLEGAGLALPEKVVVHGMLTVNGEKMSKSRGTFLNARQYLDAGLDPEWLRFYYAGNLGARPEDIDLNLEDLGHRINAELVNNVANLCHRAISFAVSKLEGRVGKPKDPAFAAAAQEKLAEIREHFAALEFRRAVRAIGELADMGNLRFQDEAPWERLKQDPEAARQTVTECVNLAKLLAIAISPIVPRMAQQIASELGVESLKFSDDAFDVQDRVIGPAIPLATRVDKEAMMGLIQVPEGSGIQENQENSASKKGGGKKTKPDQVAKSPKASAPQAQAKALPEGLIAFEDFAKVQLRVGKILSAEKVEGADKLLKLQVDLSEDKARLIVAGIALSYSPEELIGKQVAVVANLAPRKLRGILSEGMLLAATGADGQLQLLEIPQPIAAGASVK